VGLQIGYVQEFACGRRDGTVAAVDVQVAKERAEDVVYDEWVEEKHTGHECLQSV
jgi:hypothetical protein